MGASVSRIPRSDEKSVIKRKLSEAFCGEDERAVERKPDWLKKKMDTGAVSKMTALLRSLSLHTVCESADCPNRESALNSAPQRL